MTLLRRLRPTSSRLWVGFCLGISLGLGACGGGPSGAEHSAPAPDPSSRPSEQDTAGAGTSADTRDILLITVDTLRADALGFSGNPRASTPVLDRLAAEGRVFTNAHAHNVVTLPSHTNILTGRLPFEHGVRDNAGFVVPSSLPTAATLLREAGFATAAVVAAFPLDGRFGLDRGFDLYDDRYPEGSHGESFRLVERRGDEVVRVARSWWDEQADERRFLWIHLFDPHAPYEAPEPWGSRFQDDPYLGEVAATDAFLAPLLEPILGDESTLVVFTSDHGEALGEHGELTHGLFAYEGTLRVPLVVRAPGGQPLTTDTPARHIDILPTLLDAAGAPVPDDLPGRSLLGPPDEDDEAITTYFEALSANLNRGWAPLRGVIEKDEKLISLPLPELYDLQNDPAEEVNLLAGESREARQRARALSAELPEADDPQRGTTGAADAAALRSLGYLSGSAARKERYTAEDDPKRLIGVDRQIFEFIDLYQQGRLDEATRLARAIVESQPQMATGYYHLAQVLLERGLPGEALTTLERAVERGATDPTLLRQLGLLLAQSGRAGEAVDLLQPLRGSVDPENLNALGLALSEAGRQREAREVLLEVFAHDPRNPTAQANLALVALRRQDFAKAADRARQALDLNPRLALAWNYLGVSLYNLGRPTDALGAWERSVEIEPRNFDVLYNIGLVAAEAGETDRAAGALRRFAAEAPADRYGPDIAKARQILRQLEEHRR